MHFHGRRVTPILLLMFSLTGCSIADRLTGSSDTLPDLSIRRFSASPLGIAPGTAVTLNWDVVGAAGVELEGVGAVGLKGSHQVRPSGTTIYTLRAHTTEAAAAASVRVTVR